MHKGMKKKAIEISRDICYNRIIGKAPIKSNNRVMKGTVIIMTITTLKKMVKAITDWKCDINDVEELSRISIDESIFEYGSGLVKTVLDCFYLVTDYSENIIIAMGNNQINIFATVHHNNYCEGFDYISCVDIKNKTQFDIMGELAYRLENALYSVR